MHYKTEGWFKKKLRSIPSRCEKCEHFMCYPNMLFVRCVKRMPFKSDCPKYFNSEEHRRRNENKKPVKVEWKDEYIYTEGRTAKTPYCPTCGKYASPYLGHCIFCSQPFLEEEDPREKSITVYYIHDGCEWTLTEVGEYHTHIYACNGYETMHALNDVKHTEEELKQMLVEFVATRQERG